MFASCRRIPASARGELEIVDAVRDLVARGVEVRVVPVAAGVLDLATRADVAEVGAALRGREVRL